MTGTEVKDRLFEDFCRWMRGQTVGFNDDGSVNYYRHDVEAYCRAVDRLVVERYTNPND